MESNEISLHQLRVFEFVREAGRWVTATEIQDGTGVSPRTARHHALKLAKLGLFDQAEVFPGHRYRISQFAEQRNKDYMLRLEQAREVFGVAS
jgi:predicted transcriptional regulator of viral defense system